MAAIRSCRICRDAPQGKPLPHEPRPVVRVSAGARILVCGQAPGARVHASGLPFDDASGDRLRDWMGVSREEFYDEARVAFAPMGFCFPGYDDTGSDLPPRPECARTWRAALVAGLDQADLVLLVGRYAQRWHLGPAAGDSLSACVAGWRGSLLSNGGRKLVALPHPSWRNTAWLRRNHWFEDDLVPVLRREVRTRLEGQCRDANT